MKRIVLFVFLSFSQNIFADPPSLLLAKNYYPEISINNYWVSEKLDGVRAYWDGKNLISRQGNVFNAPSWFINVLPNIGLDGELWIGRHQFDKVSGIVRRKQKNDSNWLNIRYMIFDLPNNLGTFDQRIEHMRKIIQNANVDHFKMIEQFKVKSHQELKEKLDVIVNLGGEGLMLHKGSSLYNHGRSNDLLKLKKYFDTEATVIRYIGGKGKYKNMLGSLLVETSDQRRFKIGTGFSDEERRSPPSIGSVITYKYFGLTSKGNPRFASFMRVR